MDIPFVNQGNERAICKLEVINGNSRRRRRRKREKKCKTAGKNYSFEYRVSLAFKVFGVIPRSWAA